MLLSVVLHLLVPHVELLLKPNSLFCESSGVDCKAVDLSFNESYCCSLLDSTGISDAFEEGFRDLVSEILLDAQGTSGVTATVVRADMMPDMFWWFLEVLCCHVRQPHINFPPAAIRLLHRIRLLMRQGAPTVTEHGLFKKLNSFFEVSFVVRWDI